MKKPVEDTGLIFITCNSLSDAASEHKLNLPSRIVFPYFPRGIRLFGARQLAED